MDLLGEEEEVVNGRELSSQQQHATDNSCREVPAFPSYILDNSSWVCCLCFQCFLILYAALLYSKCPQVRHVVFKTARLASHSTRRTLSSLAWSFKSARFASQRAARLPSLALSLNSARFASHSTCHTSLSLAQSFRYLAWHLTRLTARLSLLAQVSNPLAWHRTRLTTRLSSLAWSFQSARLASHSVSARLSSLALSFQSTARLTSHSIRRISLFTRPKFPIHSLDISLDSPHFSPHSPWVSNPLTWHLTRLTTRLSWLAWSFQFARLASHSTRRMSLFTRLKFPLHSLSISLGHRESLSTRLGSISFCISVMTCLMIFFASLPVFLLSGFICLTRDLYPREQKQSLTNLYKSQQHTCQLLFHTILEMNQNSPNEHPSWNEGAA